MVSVILLALMMGIVAGLRAMTAPALICWAVYLGWLDLSGTRLLLLGSGWVRWALTLGALTELITDQLPSTPSRTVPVQLGARILMGGLSGAAIGAGSELLLGGLFAGVIGAIAGTYGGHLFRAKLAAAFGNDHAAAILEDAIAIGGAFAIGAALH